MKLVRIGRSLKAIKQPYSTQPDWVQANPSRINAALRRALARSTGGWFVLGASRDIGGRPTRHVVADQELVSWRAGGRAQGEVFVAPAACPHMGADLCEGHVAGNAVVCPWHGLHLEAQGHGAWKPHQVYDDGVLLWVRLDDAPRAEHDQLTDEPIIAARPRDFLDGVIRVDATCDPADVIANRLDPWHGVHYHGHSFAVLSILDANHDCLTVRVAYRIAGPIVMEVDCTFHCPEPRTIVMTIVEGDGKGSVVETHATPLEHGRCAIIEATLATSDRPGFRHVLRAAGMLRPFIKRRARRLWVEDAAYAERCYALRQQQAAKESETTLAAAPVEVTRPRSPSPNASA